MEQQRFHARLHTKAAATVPCSRCTAIRHGLAASASPWRSAWYLTGHLADGTVLAATAALGPLRTG